MSNAPVSFIPPERMILFEPQVNRNKQIASHPADVVIRPKSPPNDHATTKSINPTPICRK